MTALSTAFRSLRRHRSRSALTKICGKIFYLHLQKLLFAKNDFEALFFAAIWTKNIMRFCYAGSLIILCSQLGMLELPSWPTGLVVLLGEQQWLWIAIVVIILITFSLLLVDFLPRVWATRHPMTTLHYNSRFASIYLILCFPITCIFLMLFKKFPIFVFAEKLKAPASRIKDKIIELIQEAEQTEALAPEEKKLIQSVITFRDRIVRDIMIPRVRIFSLPADTAIKEAARLIDAEGFSRIPVYRGNIDNIVGVLMYKDILEAYTECESHNQDFAKLDMPIESLVKKVLYTPETKKVSRLLTEFRNKQVHFAVVVDEYGGTEGIVTIEDILEEIVGEIADEYDELEETLFVKQSDKGWLVDANMSIIDIEEKLGITIPQDGDYDTLGGYIFYRAGAIPPKDFIIYHDDFDLEITDSNERCVKKVRITPSKRLKEYSGHL
ncbi:MAG: hemolysin family protein [Chlamydiota bacterium]